MTKCKSEHKAWAFGVSLLLGLASASLTACSNSQQENTEAGVMGRLTSVSDTQIVVEVFDHQKGQSPKAASGGAVGGSMDPERSEEKRPDGTPPSDWKQGEKPDGDRPEGTPPADLPEMKQGDQKRDRGNTENARGAKRGESKTFVLTEDTKIYKQEGEETTEISTAELELGSMLSVVADGDAAERITIQSSEH